jgi:hypothetical protein
VTLDPERGEEAAGERAGGDRGGGLAGAGPLEHVADVGVAVLLAADQVGVAGRGRVDLVGSKPSTGQGSSAPPSWRSRGWRPARDRAAQGAAVADAGADLDRVVSIFIRPPRPWPSWRRAMSRSSASRSSSSPAGMPSTIATSPGRATRRGGEAKARAHRRLGYLRRSPHRFERRFARPVQMRSERAPWRTRTSTPSTTVAPAAAAASSSRLGACVDEVDDGLARGEPARHRAAARRRDPRRASRPGRVVLTIRS